MNLNALALSPTRQNLWRLIVIRLLVLLAQAVSVIGAWYSGLFALEWLPLLLTLGLSAVVSLLSLLRLTRDWPVTDMEYAAQLLFDILIHSVLLYYAGGPTNPFASYFLVPLTIAAATLSWLYTAALASIAMLAYSLLLFWYHPLPLFEMRTGESQINIRVIGMWLNFAMSAGLITLFVVHMAEALRKHAERLAERREPSMRDSQLLGIASVVTAIAYGISCLF